MAAPYERETVGDDRRDWLKRFYGRRPAAIARRYLPRVTYAEAFELSEYGQRPSLEELNRRLQAPELA